MHPLNNFSPGSNTERPWNSVWTAWVWAIGLLCLSSSHTSTKDRVGPAAVTASWHHPQSSWPFLRLFPVPLDLSFLVKLTPSSKEEGVGCISHSICSFVCATKADFGSHTALPFEVAVRLFDERLCSPAQRRRTQTEKHSTSASLQSSWNETSYMVTRSWGLTLVAGDLITFY
jgi:hypothetical protein